MSHPVRVLLVDDHTLLRQGLRQLLEAQENVTVIGEAADGQQAVLESLRLQPDIILMDINMPKLNGYEASKAILTAWPEARILVMTNQDDVLIIKKFLDIGIKGYCLKDIEMDALLKAFTTVLSGETLPLSADLAEKVSQSTVLKQEPAFCELTEREKEVLLALSRGHSNQELATLLSVSPKTVHNHLYNIYSKIGVKSRSEAILWAMDAGLSNHEKP